ncbi:MAG TPA: zf-HC2 domain-containing protein [Vicinamibacterales bacterium]|nr:zf-HC2 domain-containing protein [Vicinamibacterales bacterium]
MCDDRERLIGYVYDECEGRERQEIEAHLETCHTCRREITGLREVRQDLLAWDVPDSPSVWRPFAPQRAPITWRDVPGWMLAAAASLVFFAGAAGGAATQVLLPRAAAIVVPAPPALVAATAAPPRDGLASVAMTSGPVPSDQVRDLEMRLQAMEQRLRDASRDGDARVVNASVSSRELLRRIEELRTWKSQQDDMNFAVQDSFGKLLARTNSLERDLQRVSISAPGAGLAPGKQ